jgi:spermidine/putrescine transport system permease protein
MIWHGDLTTRGKLIRRGLWFLSPGILWILLFLVLPGIALVAASFATRSDIGGIEWTFTIDNYKRFAGYGLFGWSADYLRILWRSVSMAFVTTALCVAIAYPLTFFIARRPRRSRHFWLALLVIPFWTNLVIRTYAWLLILAPELPLARLAAMLGLIEKGEALYPSMFAVYLGMISTFLPYLALPLYASVEKMEWGLVEAANDLYAGRWMVFRRVILPQTLPGLSVGIVLTFVPAMGMFVVPDMLGGAKFMLIGNLIQQQFGTSRDWPFGAALSLGLMILTLIGLRVYNRSDAKEGMAA